MADNPYLDLDKPKETVEDSNPYLQLEDTGRNREQFGEGTVAREFVEGVGSGLIGIGEGVVGLGALGVDLVAGTDYADNVTETAEYLRDVAGFDPEGIVGKGAEVITQFVVPGVGVAGKVGKGFMKARQLAGKTGKLSKTERTNLALRELGAVAGVEMAVSGDNSTTIGDWVEMGPTQTTDLIGLEGTEKNLARVGNRLKVMAEAGVIGAGLQAGLSKAGKTIGDAKVTKDVAGATKRKIDAAGTYLDELVDKRTLNAPGDDLSGLEKGLAEAVIFTRYRGATPAQIAEKRLLLDGQIKPELDKAGRIFNSIEADLDKIIKATPSGSTLDKTDTLNKVLDYMRISDPAAKRTAFSSLPKEIRKDAAKMRDHVDTLSQGVLDSKFLNDNNFMTKDGRMIKDVIQDGLGSYVRRRYKIFEDAKYTPDEKTIKVADNYFRKNKRLIGKELTRLARADVDDVFNDQFLRSNGLDRTGTGDKQIITVLGQPSETVVKKAREGYLNRYSLKKNEKLKGGFVAKDRLDTGMFISREKIAPALRSLLGEVDDPRAAVLGTVADLAQFNAIDDYFGSIAKMAETNTGIGKFFRNGKDLSEAQKKELTRRGYVKLGGDDGAASVLGSAGKNADAEKLIGRTGWGSLDGHYVPKQIYKDLTNQVAGESNWGVEMLKGGLGVALKAKGLSQYSKTVLSPVTQVRNFTTAVMFATANGNMPVLGRGSNFKDSATAVFSDIFNKGSEAVFDDLADAQRRGILGTNAELREIQDQLSKGIGYSNSAEVRPRNFIEAVRGKTTDNKYAQGVGKVASGFEKAYQGSDDLWKYFSYHSEQAKLRHALDGASEADKIKYLTKNMDDVTIESQQAIRNGTANMDELIKTRAAQIVRDTVPNYNKGASEFIKLGRKLPFGNFITFPAEMYRTSFNIVRQSLDDMASDIPAIQARGRQRMIGFATTTAVVPAAALEMAYAVTDVTREEMEAFKRSFGAPWMKGATLIPTGRTKDGKIKYINYSTSNPYDVLSRFANRALTEADAAMAEGKDLDQWIVDVGIGTLGEAFAPFLDEAMLTDALLDISYRGGRTSTGAQVYNPEDNGATKLFKMSGHVANTMIPNVLAVADISGGKIEASRAVRGLVGDGLGIDAISSQDKMGRQRTWKQELARLSTGVSEQEFDPKQGLRFAAYGFQRGQTDAKRMFNSLTDDFGVTPAQLLKGYQDANEAKYRNDRGYYRMIQDLRTMGISDSEIRRTLKENNIGGIKGIMRGEFEPFKITPDTYKKLLRVDALDSLPRDAIQNVQDNMRNLPLDPQVKDRREIKPVEITPSAPQSNPYLQAPSNSAPANPYLNLDQGSLLPQSPIRQASNRGPVSPELLGGNPEERAANAFLNNRG